MRVDLKAGKGVTVNSVEGAWKVGTSTHTVLHSVSCISVFPLFL